MNMAKLPLAVPALVFIAALAPNVLGAGRAGCGMDGVLRTAVFRGGEYGMHAAANLSRYRTRLHTYMADVALSPTEDGAESKKHRRELAHASSGRISCTGDSSSRCQHLQHLQQMQQLQQEMQQMVEDRFHAVDKTVGSEGPAWRRRQSIWYWLSGDGAGATSGGVPLSKAEAPVEVVGTDPEVRSRQPWYSTRYAPFAPAITCPPDQPLERVGRQGDGGKWLCGLGRLAALQGGCVIYSLGSNGDYSFEEAVLMRTPCEVHTFDCTYEEGVSIHERHSFHKVCLSQEDLADSASTEWRYLRYPSLVAWLNHTRVDILKMDIEGWEHSVVAQLHSDMHFLPRQLTVEMHTSFDWQPGGGGETVAIGALPIAGTLLHLADLGYGTVAKENNVFDPDCCTELTMLRVETITARCGD